MNTLIGNQQAENIKQPTHGIIAVMTDVSYLPRQSKQRPSISHSSLLMLSTIKPPQIDPITQEEMYNDTRKEATSLQYRQTHHRQVQSNTILNLTWKVESLETQLYDLTSRHREMMGQLLQEVRTKIRLNDELRRENKLLSGEMEEMACEIARVMALVKKQQPAEQKGSRLQLILNQYHGDKLKKKILKPDSSRSTSRSLTRSRIVKISSIQRLKSKTPGASRIKQLKQNYYDISEPSNQFKGSGGNRGKPKGLSNRQHLNAPLSKASEEYHRKHLI